MELDDRGIPILTEDQVCAPEAPPGPCVLCTGTPMNGQTSWEWCQSMRTCAATIDWDRIHKRGLW